MIVKPWLLHWLKTATWRERELFEGSEEHSAYPVKYKYQCGIAFLWQQATIECAATHYIHI